MAVLIVDDDRDTLDLLELILRNRDAEVRTASCSVEAIAALEGWTPHVMILDFAMPEEDGCSLLQRIRARPATRDVPAIAFTAHAYERDKDLTRSAGFDRYIAKPPVSLDDVGNAVAELAAASSIGDSPTSGIRSSTPPLPARGVG